MYELMHICVHVRKRSKMSISRIPTSLVFLINIKIGKESLDDNFVNPTNKLY